MIFRRLKTNVQNFFIKTHLYMILFTFTVGCFKEFTLPICICHAVFIIKPLTYEQRCTVE